MNVVSDNNAARQPEMIPTLRGYTFLVAGLVDAIAIIGVAMGLVFIFVNPFQSSVVDAAKPAHQAVSTKLKPNCFRPLLINESKRPKEFY